MTAVRPERLRPPRPAGLPPRTRPPSASGWGWLPGLSVIVALGLVLVAVADNGARVSASWGQPLFWAGLVVLFAPVAARLSSVQASRSERLALVVMVGLGLYLVKILHQPVAFTFHDELGFWRNTHDIVVSGHLFEPDPIVGSYAVYPGLQIATDALVKLGGLSIFQAGVIVVGACRLVLTASLFVLFERATGSARMAGLSVLVYMTNPNFLFFDAEFGYESFALPLAALALVVVGRFAHAPRGRRAGLAVLVLVLAVSIPVSHHVTAYALVGFLFLWAVASAWSGRRRPRGGLRIAVVGLVTLATVVSWLVFVAGGATRSELLPVGTGIVSGLGHLFSTGSGGKKLFHATVSGQADALWTQVVGFASVALILVLLPGGLWRAAKGRRRSAVMVALAAAALAYPATLGLRLTAAGSETSNRASEFAFFGVGVIVALGLAALWHWQGNRQQRRKGRHRARRPQARPRAAMVAAYTSVLLVGGVIIGWPPYDLLPGPFLPGADERSITVQGVDAAYWARRVLGPNNTIAADATDALLMGSYGGQKPQTGEIGGVSVAELFFSTTFTPTDLSIIRGDKIRYIVVDDRLAHALPLQGGYFDAPNPPSYKATSPISEDALTKFSLVRGMARLFDSGSIQVYGTAGLLGPRSTP